MNDLKWEIATTDDHRGYTKLRYATWPRGRNPSRFVVFVNGRTEWIEKYPNLPEWLNLPDDVGFLTWDHCGQGGSGGERSWIDHYDTYAKDAQRIIQLVVGNRGFIIIAHSMGGLISLYSTMKGMLRPRRLILCSPLFQLPQKPLPEFIARPTSWLLSLTRYSKSGTGAGKHDRAMFENNRLTHDEATFRRIQNSPYPCPSASFGWVSQTYRATDYIHSNAAISGFQTPTLILVGEDERVVDPMGFDRWINKARANSTAAIDYQVIPEGRHELFSETQKIRDQAVNAIRQWASDFLA
jgi:lysophospholipase